MSRLTRWFKHDEDEVKKETPYITVTPGVDPERPDNKSDIGKLYNRMNPPGVLGTAYKTFGG